MKSKLPFVGRIFWKVFGTIIKLPFVGRIFWKVFVTIIVLLVAGWILIPRLSSYEITNADYGGSSICSVILSYLLHLWLLPPEESTSNGE